MKKLVFSLVAIIALVGCGNYTGETVYENSNNDNSTNNSGNDNGNGGDTGSGDSAPDLDDSAYPAIPDYPEGANSLGILEVNCKDDIIYYTLSYACFKTTVKLSTTANGKPTSSDENSKEGSPRFVYFERGHYERDGSSNGVELIGTVTGGNPGGTYTASCAATN